MDQASMQSPQHKARGGRVADTSTYQEGDTIHSTETQVATWLCDGCLKRGQSCETEPLTCGIRHHLQVGGVRTGLNCRTPMWGSQRTA